MLDIKYIIGLLFTFLVLSSCEDVPEFEADEAVPVVEGFLYEGSAVEDITISEVVPFDSATFDSGLGGLSIQINWNDNSYFLEENNEASGKYFYPGNDLSIIQGETYEMQFMYNGELITSTTTVPSAPFNLNLSTNSIDLPQILDFTDLRSLAENDNIQINLDWDALNESYFFIVIENITEDPEPIDVNNTLNFNFEFTSSPIQDNFFTILPFIHYTQFGVHRIIVFTVNEEYALLYETAEQDSRDLNEPFSNINNGVGIFSAFSSDTTFLEIRKD